jgi:hypothetical protein
VAVVGSDAYAAPGNARPTSDTSKAMIDARKIPTLMNIPRASPGDPSGGGFLALSAQLHSGIAVMSLQIRAIVRP